MEWLSTLTLAELSEVPRFVMKNCFLSFGQPNLAKPTTVICIPRPRGYDFNPKQMVETVGNVAGLHYKKALGSKAQTIYMSWDAAAVEKSAEKYAAREEMELQDGNNDRYAKRNKMLMDYLNTLQSKNQVDDSKAHNSPASPLGSYILNSEDLEKCYGYQGISFTLDINHGSMHRGNLKLRLTSGFWMAGGPLLDESLIFANLDVVVNLPAWTAILNLRQICQLGWKNGFPQP
jgi:hypothetical protein